jgi:integrase
MAPRRRLTEEQVPKLPTKKSRYAFPDPQTPGLYVRVHSTGKKSYVTVRQNQWTTLGDTRLWTLEQARAKARQILLGEIAPQSIEEVCKAYRELHVDRLRSRRDVNRALDKLVCTFHGRPFASIKRRELVALADRVNEQSGARSAEYLLAIFSALTRWHMARDDHYVSPAVSAMARPYRTAARDRILADDEIRAIWLHAEKGGVFGALVRLLLLTAQRRAKVVSMKWDDINNGVWTIATEAGEKGNAKSLVLPKAALDIIAAQPHVHGNPYVLGGIGSHIKSFDRRKQAFDKATGVTGWTLHDCRRTARSLLARAGVRPDLAERLLGHGPKGIESVYDRYSYREEKASALRVLAAMIDSIVHPSLVGNVLPLLQSA